MPALPPLRRAKGHIGFISQSGALCTSVLDWALDEGIGFSYFVSVGNMLDVSMGDLIDYFGSATETRSIILYIESISESREFMSAARAFARTKPIVAYKAGRYAESAQAAASHTGAMAGVDDVYEAAFQRAGIERIFQIEDMFDFAELLARQQQPKGDRLAIITNAGGPGVMTTDKLIEHEGKLATISRETIETLNDLLPICWSHGNPIDVLGDAPPDRFAKAVEVVLKDKNVDAVLVILTPQAMTDPTATAEAVAKAAAHAHKPILASWMGGRVVAEGTQKLNAAGIPTYGTPEKAVRAFMHLVSYARNLLILHETPRDMPLEFTLDRKRLRGVFDTILTEGRRNPFRKRVEGISGSLRNPRHQAPGRPHRRRGRGSRPSHRLPRRFKDSFPADHSQDRHRRRGVESGQRHSGSRCIHQDHRSGQGQTPRSRNHRRHRAKNDHLPQQLRADHGHEKGPHFRRGDHGRHGRNCRRGLPRQGPGSAASERSPGPPHARIPQILAPLARLPRQAGANIDRLIEIIMRFSYLVADYPEIKELDINPLLVTPEDVIALDARVVIDRDLVIHAVRPYAHLAIRPYPEEFVTERKMKDDTPVILRPIKPEDEPMWHELLGSCSTQSLWFRFSYLFKQTTHEMATRYCFIDYDRELGIVAEVEEEGQRKLIGIGRLVADMNHETAEYAVIVIDRWHGHGLGGLLTDYCCEVAKKWGVKRVVAETSKDNTRMIATFRNRGFEINDKQEEDVVLVSKNVV